MVLSPEKTSSSVTEQNQNLKNQTLTRTAPRTTHLVPGQLEVLTSSLVVLEPRELSELFSSPLSSFLGSAESLFLC